MAVLPACCVLDLNRLKGLIGHGEVRLATMEEISRAIPDCAPGVIPPFGALWGLRTFVDRGLLNRRDVTMPAGDPASAIRMRATEYVRVARPSAGEFAVFEALLAARASTAARRSEQGEGVTEHTSVHDAGRPRRPGRVVTMVGELCTKPVVTISKTATVEEAARLMRTKKVGALVVTNGGRLVGILTDRDIAVDVVGTGKHPAETMVTDVMRSNPASLREDQGLFEAAKIFSAKGVRRLPVTTKTGKLVGILTLDDLLMLLGREMEMVSAAVAQGVGRTRLAS
jgi:CBS domain-containing protein